MKRSSLHDHFFVIKKIYKQLRNSAIKKATNSNDEAERIAFQHLANLLDEEIMNLELSYFIKKMGINVAITDIDNVIIKNNQVKALFELKHRNEDYKRVVMVNARQYMTHKRICKLTGNIVPFYYIFKIEDPSYYKCWWRILELDPFRKVNFVELGKNGSRDKYAVFELDDSILMNELEFTSWLREIL
ncbi:hypothetical protein DRP07_00775 [Archaeoglobales archaeon]|nr:MAG: hypothetical protein DRP07_00775 [Archaeoglobales archaeon]